MTATVHYHDRTVTFDEVMAESLGLIGEGELQVEMTSVGVLLKSKKNKAVFPSHPLPLEVRMETFLKPCGIWKNRTDLPDFAKLRAEADRF